MTTNFRSFRKVYNPKTGRHMLQRWDGGIFFDSVTQIKPKIVNAPSITGSGHQPVGSGKVKMDIKSVEEEASDIGNAILNRLKIRSGKGIENPSVEDRLKNIIKGSGLQVSM